jgi:pimeloyl-ACP methyl ester carboxylesterase
VTVTDTGAVPEVGANHEDVYAPYPVVADLAGWGLTTTTVSAAAGPTVVQHRPGPRPLLFLHGVAGSWTTWTPFLSAAEGIAGRGLVLVDLPGWGSSPAPTVPLDVDESSQVLVDVLDALGLDQVDVVGHSMGAFVGLHLTVTRPDRVRSLGLVSGTTFATAAAARHPVRALRTLPAFTLLRAGLGVTRGAAHGLLRGLAGIGLLPLLAGPVFATVRRLDPSVLQAFVDEFRPAGLLGAARSAARYDTRRWSAVRCPVVAIAGRQDVFARVDDLARLRGVLPDVRTVLLEDCGHFAHVERPDAVVRELLS